jgi:hypothetical protein
MSHSWATLNAYKILITKPQTRRQIWEYRHLGDRNIKICVVKAGFKCALDLFGPR